MKTIHRLYIVFFVCMVVNLSFLYAQSMLKLSVSQADSLFMSRNFLLLAKKFEVLAQKSLVYQAKLWDNPSAYLEQIIYNPLTNRYLDMSYKGEYLVQVQQLLYTAGKRNKRIQLAMLQHQMSVFEFNFLMAQLKYELHSAFYTLAYQKKLYKIFSDEINDLAIIVQLYQEQFEKGNISLKEVFRLKSLLFNIQSSQNDLYNQIAEQEKILGALLGLSGNIEIQPEVGEVSLFDEQSINLTALIDTALNYRMDYLLAKYNVEYQRAYLNLQKALAVPDIKLGYSFDKAGNMVDNYSGISIGIDLPFFNLNQGQIRYAENIHKMAEYELKQKELEIQQEIRKTYSVLVKTKFLLENTQKDFLTNFDNIKDGMQNNFKKRNISVLEYADFFESYINSSQQYYQLLIQYHLQKEQFNFNIGKTLLK